MFKKPTAYPLMVHGIHDVKSAALEGNDSQTKQEWNESPRGIAARRKAGRSKRRR